MAESLQDVDASQVRFQMMPRMFSRTSWVLIVWLMALHLARGDETSSAAKVHPLERPRAMIRGLLDTIRTVQDYACLLKKRERIEGRLQPYQYIAAQVRRPVVEDGVVIRPMAFSLEYLAPARLQGRRVYFEEGANDGNLLVVRGQGVLGRVALKISPESAVARRESLNRVTDISFEQMALSLLDRIDEEIRLDPDATNTRVDYYEHAAVDKRVCSVIRVTHPRRQEGLIFHVADFFVDDELNLPIRIATFDWPEGEADRPPVISEFNYTQLKINIGLADADFPPVLTSEP